MSNAPDTIYFQIDEGWTPESGHHPFQNATWSVERIEPSDIRYIRAPDPAELRAALLLGDDVDFCDGCVFLIPSENNQGRRKEPHVCTRYNEQVKHRGCHPSIVRLKKCDYHSRLRRRTLPNSRHESAS